MGRGVRLVCEACDYRADLFERTPGQGRPAVAGGAGGAGAEEVSLTSYLCPQCVEPRDLPLGTSAVCSRCSAPLLDFATAAEELAVAARTRVALDLRSEVAGRERLVRLLALLGTLRAQEQGGALTGRDVISTLVAALHQHVSAGAVPASAWLPLGDTAALGGLESALAGVASSAMCASLLSARLEEADRAIGTLEHQIDEEASLPGVPCPRCGTGQLLHWPIWV